MEKENTLSKNMYDYSKGAEIINLVLIGISALVVPTFLAKILISIFGANSFIALNSQIIVGSIVNIALITTAINIKGWKKIIGIITLPSISAILGGYIFKTASVYMCYMIPAIWLGNFALVYFYKELLLKRKINYFITGIISISIKVRNNIFRFQFVEFNWFIPRKNCRKLTNSNGNNSRNNSYNRSYYNIYCIYH